MEETSSEEIVVNEKIKIERQFINENEVPDNLDFPDEPSDIYLYKLKCIPEIKELENMYFDYQSARSETGIYLISWNEINNGMSFWYLNYETRNLQNVKDLDSAWWILTEDREKISLITTTKKKDIEIKIEKI